MPNIGITRLTNFLRWLLWLPAPLSPPAPQQKSEVPFRNSGPMNEFDVEGYLKRIQLRHGPLMELDDFED